ncbi:predicted protein [Aspergillus nidulans FGSC A4]|uniref:BHLH domain-containing protein n=1 Tax=Emericella nidulans (strain FGSC A4 / ATCC 38163 / CBS 112.46 / NRRL 194 / M139) TaxID=227321 RepID=Q5B9G9_EMENI|nr:hypothetical protein [Aspergillus nidulans FGSC A4]EAA62917.1 predicted protein [Aspergillus nidulans FGSC A4]CBF83967.1 TPA: conserved hypothetical protein [Aspergillus nidulans FGSC A4]|eukprot:XP_660415.1 predicted protein [Aspergillus nidulans FGSC A4]
MLMWHLCQPGERDIVVVQARTLTPSQISTRRRRPNHKAGLQTCTRGTLLRIGLGKWRRSGSDRETQQAEMSRVTIPTSRRPRNEKPLAGATPEKSHAQAMPTMSNELDYRSASLGRSSTTTAIESTSKRSSFSIPSKKQNQKLTELRPKGPLVLVAPASSIEFKRKQHAQAQKLQRDRMKSALDRMARMLATGTGGVHAGTASCGTKAELVEAAVEYIERLHGQLEELRASHATERTSINAKQAKSPYERSREDTDAQITGFPEDGPRFPFMDRDWSRWPSK